MDGLVWLRHAVRHQSKKARFKQLRAEVRGEYSLAPYDQHRAIFVHVPRTGGVAIARELFGCLAGGHRTVHQYRTVFGPWTFRRYFTFGFVRNPYDRVVFRILVSQSWRYERAGSSMGTPAHRPFDDFRQFVRAYFSERERMPEAHFRPQAEFSLRWRG